MSSSQALGAALGSRPGPDDASSDACAHEPCVSLYLEAQGLPNMEARHAQGKSNPFCIVELRDEDDRTRSTTIAQTETVYNNLDPKWARTFTVNYKFGVAQVLRFNVYNREEKGNDLSRQRFIGSATCTVAQIVLSDSQRHTLQLSDDTSTSTPLASGRQKRGRLVVRAEELKTDMGESVTLQFGCIAVRNAKKPFFVLCRQTRDGAFAPVKYSEVLRTYQPSKSVVNKFKPFSINLVQLCNADKDRRLCLQFYNFNRHGKHESCGVYYFTLSSLEKDYHAASSEKVPPGSKKRAATCSLTKIKSSGIRFVVGTLAVLAYSLTSTVSFLDYITTGGVVIHTVFAIDMSSTNGNPADPASLHYNNPNGPNEYEAAIRQVGAVLAEYDSTQIFPAWGFSACLPPTFTDFSHCFPLSDSPNAICTEVKGVVDAYRYKLAKVAPHRPCRYGDVLKKVIGQVKEEDKRTGHGVYTVLVLITDGDFDDFPVAADEICKAAELPLSIVVVGIGSAETPLLEKLDGDEEKLCDSDGVPASRDIVQHVPFQKHRGNPAALTKEVLDEIPDQLLSYYRSLGLTPEKVRAGIGGSSASSVCASPAVLPQVGEDDVSALSDDLLSNFTLGGVKHDGKLSERRPSSGTISEGSNSNPLPGNEAISSVSLAVDGSGSGGSPITAAPSTPIYPTAPPASAGQPLASQPSVGHAMSYIGSELGAPVSSYPRSASSGYTGQPQNLHHWTPAYQPAPPPVAHPLYAPSHRPGPYSQPPLPLNMASPGQVYPGPPMAPLSSSLTGSSTAAPPPPPVGNPLPGAPVVQPGIQLSNSYTICDGDHAPQYMRQSPYASEAPPAAHYPGASQPSYAALQGTYHLPHYGPAPSFGPPPPPGPPVASETTQGHPIYSSSAGPPYSPHPAALQYSAQEDALQVYDGYPHGGVPPPLPGTAAPPPPPPLPSTTATPPPPPLPRPPP